MPRRRSYSRNKKPEDAIAGILALLLLGLIGAFINNPGKVATDVLIIIALVIIFFLLKRWFHKRHFNNLIDRLQSSGQEEYLKNFINRFGLEGGKGDGYTFRNHRFDWDRINDLKKILEEKGVASNDKDIFTLLRTYIQEKEEQVTRESIKKEPQNFTILSGTDFEKLLYRLFEAMGYKTELIGKSGDQGGDLIANKEGERILIQAKAYRDWSTGNAAVQQVGTAIKYYNCNKAMVITTSYFTPEAIILAKSNNIELISKTQLQELILKYLGESWF